jgi:hypothetical protein
MFEAVAQRLGSKAAARRQLDGHERLKRRSPSPKLAIISLLPSLVNKHG